LNNLGSIQTLRGELGDARAQLAEALSLSQRMGNRRRTAFTLSAIATLAAVDGEAERAVRLDAAASAAIAAMGAVLPRPMRESYIPHLERARETLGVAAAERASAAGQTMSLAQAVEGTMAWLAEPERADQLGERQVSEELPPPVNAPPVLVVAAKRSADVGLSPREVEVAALVARGLTNRQIAAELVITEGTAANHVKHILARLVLDSRVQIATWAIERGLHHSAAS
jgi:DNA-binding CsgD family transcriptional regulator